MTSTTDNTSGAADKLRAQGHVVATSLWDLLRATWKSGSLLPKDSSARKDFPVYGGFDAYFPAAIVAVAGWSNTSNQKHNPGQPLQHARGKSPDHKDCQRRHGLDSADPSCDKLEELTCKAWRAMAELQEYAESLGAPVAPAATFQAPAAAQSAPPAEVQTYNATCIGCGLRRGQEPSVQITNGEGPWCNSCYEKTVTAPATEQWGVFYQHPDYKQTPRRSTEVPWTYACQETATAAAEKFCKKMNSCNWFAQKI